MKHTPHNRLSKLELTVFGNGNHGLIRTVEALQNDISEIKGYLKAIGWGVPIVTALLTALINAIS